VLVGDRHRRQDEAQLLGLGLAEDLAADLVEADVAVAGPALARDALVAADVELDDVVAVLALEAARDLARQHGEERAVEVDDAALVIDDEVAVDDRRRRPLELGEELLQRGVRLHHPQRSRVARRPEV
jgi:hypothetical protein